MAEHKERCTDCMGRKTIVGLGMITHTCTKCNGVGYIVRNVEPEITKLEESEQNTTKRGRPKKEE